MSQLLKKVEMAEELCQYLENQLAKGYEWVVYDTDNPIATLYDLHCFADEDEALDFAREYQQIWNWHEAVPIGDMVFNLKELDRLRPKTAKQTTINKDSTPLKTEKVMNLNNLYDLRDEMKMLGFSDKLVAQMEENMKKDVPEFKLHDTINAAKGRVDLTLHFKQSGQSEYYYLNRFEAALNKGKALEAGQKYWVVLPPKDGKPQFRGVEHAAEAIELFKAQKGDSQLSIGKAFDGSGMVASMENGKVNFVDRNFQSTYYSQSLPQTFWVDRGKGFTAEQAINLVQGRAVYRDDLLSRDGVPYKAWMQLDTDKARDRHNNLGFKQFNDPSYGFDLGKVLDSFKIKDTEDPAKREKLETALRNGNRPLVTAVKEGQDVKLYVEAAVRYGKLNFYDMDGKPEKREVLMKESTLSQGMANSRTNEQRQQQSQGMRI